MPVVKARRLYCISAMGSAEELHCLRSIALFTRSCQLQNLECGSRTPLYHSHVRFHQVQRFSQRERIPLVKLAYVALGKVPSAPSRWHNRGGKLTMVSFSPRGSSPHPRVRIACC
jgi:hypothetical protein